MRKSVHVTLSLNYTILNGANAYASQNRLDWNSVSDYSSVGFLLMLRSHLGPLWAVLCVSVLCTQVIQQSLLKHFRPPRRGSRELWDGHIFALNTQLKMLASLLGAHRFLDKAC